MARISEPDAQRSGVEPARASPPGGILLASVATSAFVLVVLLATGVTVSDALRLVAVLAVQSLAGVLLWLLARRAVAVHLAELIGAGLAVGAVLSLLAQQALRQTPLEALAWAVPSALVAACCLHPRLRSPLRRVRIEPPRVDEWGVVAGGVLFGLVALVPFWRRHPLEWDGWWSTYVDIAYNEALARSIVQWGPFDSALAAGESVRYHWFSAAWAGVTTDAAGVGPYVVQTRLLPLVALIASVCLIWAWTRRLSGSEWAPAVAVALLVASAWFGAWASTWSHLHFLAGFLLSPFSPSQLLSTMWLLGLALVFTEHLRGRIGLAPALLVLLALACVGGKSSIAAVAACAVIAVAGVACIRRDPVWPVSVRSGALVVVTIGVGGLLLLSGATENHAAGLGLETTLGFARTLGAAVAWAGLVWFLLPVSRPRPVEVWMAAGAIAGGVGAFFLLDLPVGNQHYFLLAAGVLVAPFSAWGAVEAIGRTVPRWLVGVASVVGVTTAVASALLGEAGQLGLAILVVWPVAIAVVVVVSFQQSSRADAGSLPAVGSGLVVLLSACLAFGAITIVRANLAGAEDGGNLGGGSEPVGAALAWTTDHQDLLGALGDRSEPADVVMTNRICDRPDDRPPDCQSYTYLVSPLAGRRTYLEGFDFGVSLDDLAPWAAERAERSVRFARDPGRADAEVLWDAGVRWVFVDRLWPAADAWVPWAEVVLQNPAGFVLRLVDPATISTNAQSSGG